MNFLNVHTDNWISIGLIFLIIFVSKIICYIIYKMRSKNKAIKEISFLKLVGYAVLISSIAAFFIIINFCIINATCMDNLETAQLWGIAKRTEFILAVAVPVIIESRLIKKVLKIEHWGVWVFSFLSTWGIIISMLLFMEPDYFEPIKHL